jgi:hypothetical protein
MRGDSEAIEQHAEILERAERRVERVHRFGTRDDHDLRSVVHRSLHRVRECAVGGFHEPGLDQTRAEPRDLLGKGVAEATERALTERLLDHGCHLQRAKCEYPNQRTALVRDPLHFLHVVRIDDERRDLGARHGLASVHDLAVVERVDADPLDTVRTLQTLDVHAQEPAARRGDWPVAA